LNWNDGAGVGFLSPKNQDKEWLGVDLHSPLYKGNIYMTWTEFDNYGSSSPSDSSRIRFSRSTDRGLSWSNTITISDRSGDCIDEDNTVEGAVPCVGPNGEVYVSWAGPLGLMFDKSTNGGTSWNVDKFVTTIPGGWDYAVPGIYRANGLPVTACDTSQSPFRGNIYINWTDQRNGTGNTDVFITKSTDGGNTWSSVKKVNDDNTTRHQFFTWMTIDQTTGILYFIFYDRRNTANNLTDVYAARSTDGGETFTNFKVSESSFNPSSSIFFGDYTNIAAMNKMVYPIWMRLDNDALTIWTAIVNDSSAIIPVELSSFTANLSDRKVNLYWQTVSELNNGGFEIQRISPSSTPSLREGTLEYWRTIGFINGMGTTTESSDYNFTDEPTESGLYSYRLKQIDFDGSYELSNEIEVNFIFANDFRISQNYPNPFNPSTTIEYQIPQSSFVTIKVYDVLGKEIITLVNEEKPAGIHEVTFEPKDLTSGLYLYKISAGGFEQTMKMLFLK